MFIDTQHQVFTLASFSFNALSFLSCLWVFYLYTKSPSPHTVQFKMLVNLTISDFLIAITGFLTHFLPKTNEACSVSVFLSLVGFWSSAFWSATVAIFSYKKIVRSNELDSGKFFNISFALWTAICVAIPLMPIFGLFGIRYVASENFCAISFNTSSLVLFLVSEGIPIMTALIVTAVFYIKQVRALKKMPNFVLSMMNVKANNLFWYPFAQCLVFVPGLICQLVYAFYRYDSTFFNVIRIYGFRLAGVVNSGVYGLQRVKLGKSQSVMVANSTRAQSLLDPNEDLYAEVDAIDSYEEIDFSIEE